MELGGVEITTVIAALLRNPEATAKERRKEGGKEGGREGRKEGLVTPPLTKGVPLPCSSARLSPAELSSALSAASETERERL